MNSTTTPPHAAQCVALSCPAEPTVNRHLAATLRLISHEGMTLIETCPAGCCQQYVCVACGMRWTVEYPPVESFS